MLFSVYYGERMRLLSKLHTLRMLAWSSSTAFLPSVVLAKAATWEHRRGHSRMRCAARAADCCLVSASGCPSCVNATKSSCLLQQQTCYHIVFPLDV